MKKSLMTTNSILYFLLFAVELYTRGLLWGLKLPIAFEYSKDDIAYYYENYFGTYYYFWPILMLVLFLVSLWFMHEADIMTEKAFWIMGVCTFPLYAWLCVNEIVDYYSINHLSISDNVAYVQGILGLLLVTPIFINLVICAIATGRERRALNKRLDEATS